MGRARPAAQPSSKSSSSGSSDDAESDDSSKSSEAAANGQEVPTPSCAGSGSDAEGKEEAEQEEEGEEGASEESDGSGDMSEGEKQTTCVCCEQKFGTRDSQSPDNETVLVERRSARDLECKACFNARTGSFGRGATHIRRGRRSSGHGPGKPDKVAAGHYFPKLLQTEPKVKKKFMNNRKGAVTSIGTKTGSKQSKRYNSYHKSDDLATVGEWHFDFLYSYWPCIFSR
jgi:hypothetical protein